MKGASKLPRFFLVFIFSLLAVVSFIIFSKKTDKKLVIAPKTITEVAIHKKNKEQRKEYQSQKTVPSKETAHNPNLTNTQNSRPLNSNCDIPDEHLDLIDSLFTTVRTKKLPIVETITYTSRVPWLKGRPAWIADYAAHYNTTRHFIARSLNKRPDYFTQKVAHGDKFNVLKKDLNFHLLISLAEAKMRFYAVDTAQSKRYLIKTYQVGLGRKDPASESGYLTPKGRYLLGERVAVYKPGIMGYFQDRQIEMIRIFGTRWIPFEQELEGATLSAKGFGLHGAPWINDPQTSRMIEDRERIGAYDSDGCIRLYSEDMEELFSIIISKPTIVEIVNDFSEAKLSELENNNHQQ